MTSRDETHAGWKARQRERADARLLKMAEAASHARQTVRNTIALQQFAMRPWPDNENDEPDDYLNDLIVDIPPTSRPMLGRKP